MISEVHSTQQLYRLSQFVADTTAVAPLSSSAGKVLSFGIGTRQDAVRTLEYIEDLQTKIESNLAELDTTISALQDTAAVLRSARSVVDEVSQRIGDDASAAELAQGLQQAIQSDARLADLAHDSDQLAQSENLPLLLEAAQLRG